MVKAKVSAREADDGTLLKHITGVGPSTLCLLANCGYNFKPTSTLGDFKKETQSFEELQKTMSDRGISGGYTLPKLRNLWSGGDGSVGKKRGRQEDEVADQELLKKRKVMEESQTIDKTDSDRNFLLEPKTTEPHGEIEKTDEKAETPEIDALTRSSDPGAMATGDVSAKVDMSVIPDVTLTVSPDDKAINAPSEVMPETPIPIIPGIAIGPSYAQVRHVAPQTLEEKQEDIQTAEDLPSVKAAGGKDLGGDGYGSLLTEGRVGKDQPQGDNPEEDEEKELGVSTHSGGKKFTSKALELASTPSFDDKDEVKPFDMRGATRHPFKQAGLFRDHDMATKVSKLIDQSFNNRVRTDNAHSQAISNRDLSWTRYNPATQGVAMADMPTGSSNYLMRGPMVSDYQLFGPNPLRPTFAPCSFINEQLSGRFR